MNNQQKKIQNVNQKIKQIKIRKIIILKIKNIYLKLNNNKI